MRDNQTGGTPIATAAPASAPKTRRRVSFIVELVSNGEFRLDGVAAGGPKDRPFQQVSLTLGAVGYLTPPVHRKGLLFEQPTGPGGRRSTPDSAMRPRARTCLEDPHPEEPRERCLEG